MMYERVPGLHGRLWRKGKDVVAETTDHPAKFKKDLIHWIARVGLERGWWTTDTLIIDPFAGVALGGLAAAHYNVPWLGIELEQKFVDIGERNLISYVSNWREWGELVLPKVIQGDSRRLVEIVQEQVDQGEQPLEVAGGRRAAGLHAAVQPFLPGRP